MTERELDKIQKDINDADFELAKSRERTKLLVNQKEKLKKLFSVTKVEKRAKDQKRKVKDWVNNKKTPKKKVKKKKVKKKIKKEKKYKNKIGKKRKREVKEKKKVKRRKKK